MNTSAEIQKFLKRLANNGRLTKLATSADNQRAPVHRWFPFLAGFSHLLVKEVVNFFEPEEEGNLLFDPFMGSGTTGVVGKEVGINVIGNEVNPFLYKICKTKMSSWETKDSTSLHSDTRKLLELASQNWRTIDVVEEHPVLKRCYPLNNLKKLVRLRKLIETRDFSSPSEELYFFLVLTKCLISSAKVGINVPYISWSAKKKPKEVFSLFKDTSQIVCEDLATMPKSTKDTIARVFPYDSRIRHSKIKSGSASIVFTSPPYLNNFDYGESLKVFLYFWKIANNWNEINRKIRRVSVTSATTYYDQTKLRSKPYEKILGRDFLAQLPSISEQIMRKSELMRIEMAKRINPRKSFDLLTLLYFKDMYYALKELHRIVKKGAPCFLVVGDSAPYGIHVPTDTLLGEIGLELGFSSYTIQPLRRRGIKWRTLRYRHNLTLREGLLIMRR